MKGNVVYEGMALSMFAHFGRIIWENRQSHANAFPKCSILDVVQGSEYAHVTTDKYIYF